MGVKLSIVGLKSAVDNIKKTAADSEKKINNALAKFALNVETDAKVLAPADEGNLRNRISSVINPFSVEIVCTVNYAAFMEFGTRKFAAQYVSTLPSDWQEYASTFKGGGAPADFFKAIMEWVKRKGIPEDAAYPIAKKILINGVKPHPFLYPAVIKHRHWLEKELNSIINE